MINVFGGDAIALLVELANSYSLIYDSENFPIPFSFPRNPMEFISIDVMLKFLTFRGIPRNFSSLEFPIFLGITKTANPTRQWTCILNNIKMNLGDIIIFQMMISNNLRYLITILSYYALSSYFISQFFLSAFWWNINEFMSRNRNKSR